MKSTVFSIVLLLYLLMGVMAVKGASKCLDVEDDLDAYDIAMRAVIWPVFVGLVMIAVFGRFVRNAAAGTKEIKIKYLREVNEVEVIAAGDWVDLRAGETVEMKAGEYRMFPLGVAMQLPKGYEALVVPRSSTFKKYGVILVNSMGIIDESYCGDCDQWQFLAYAVRDTVIPQNERICQFRIIKHQPAIKFVRVGKLGNANRGGIGRTGRV